MRRSLRAFVELTRIDSSLLGFLGVFVPHFSRTLDVHFSVGQAVPVFFTCMSTFVANDLDDVEKDAINHPHRPLPSSIVRPGTATAIYLLCTVLALLTTKHFINERLAFWYYGLIVMSVSYGYVVESLPLLKTAYVAACSAIALATVAISYPLDHSIRYVLVAMFLATVGRETCMDIRDRAGDKANWMHRLDAASLANWAFALQGLAVVVVGVSADTPTRTVAVGGMAIVLAAAYRVWSQGKRQLSIELMKVNMGLGLVFLI